MDNIILFLGLFSLTATATQLSLFRHWWQQLALALVFAAITYAFYPTAIAYSSTDIEALLADSGAMLDMSVVLVLEAVLMLVLALTTRPSSGMTQQPSLKQLWADLFMLTPGMAGPGPHKLVLISTGRTTGISILI